MQGAPARNVAPLGRSAYAHFEHSGLDDVNALNEHKGGKKEALQVAGPSWGGNAWGRVTSWSGSGSGVVAHGRGYR